MQDRWEQIKGLFAEALKLDPEQRAAFLASSCPNDASVRTEVESLLNAHLQAGQYMEIPVRPEVSEATFSPTVQTDAAADQAESTGFAPSQFPTEDARYQFGGERARGGLGRILEARDARLNRLIAVKELLDGSENAELRFIREAMITARLQHPSIVPIYDLSWNRHGKPFYSMKMVSGRSLAEVIREKKTLEERLALLPNLIAVSDAVAYAHQHGIVHRDLKPANVLIGAFGETVVIDWGLAADLQEANAPTLSTLSGALPETAQLTIAGTIMGTPEYMPPEQAQGKAVDERADVYAIGAILYHVLAGEPPYQGDSSKEVLEKVTKDEPAPIEHRQPASPPDLASIIRKAMTRDPAGRYATAKELAEDLKRFQTGQLISARHYSSWSLLERWLRKHRALVATALLILITLIAGLMTTAWQARIARLERARAERSFADVRQLANSFLFEFHDAIAKLPGSTSARVLVVKRARDYLDRLASEPGAERDTALQEELATAYIKLGGLQGLAGQGNIGDSSGALESFQRALTIRRALAEANPKDPKAQRALAEAHAFLCKILATRGDSVGARRHGEEAVRIAEAIYVSHPMEKDSQIELARALDAFGDFVVYEDLARGIELRRRALQLDEELAAAEPDDPKRRRSLSSALKKLGAALEKSGDVPHAIELYRRALTIDDERVKVDGNDWSARLDLSYSYGSLGWALLATDNTGEALEHYTRALELREAVARADPSNEDASWAVASALWRIGYVHWHTKDWPAAVRSYRRALSIRESLDATNPNDARNRKETQVIYYDLGDIHLQWALADKDSPAMLRSRVTEARRWFERALAIWKDLRQRNAAGANGQSREDEIREKIKECDRILATAPK